MGEPLVRGQRVFAAHLSAQTGLDPRVVGAWLKSEQSGSAAAGYEHRGYYDWLNIANTDSGPASGANSSAWRNPVSAAKATAEWIRGQGQIAKEYGKPAPGIRRILAAAGKSPQAQIAAIGSSGWATAPDYGQKIGVLYNELAGDQGLLHEAHRASNPGSYDGAAASGVSSLAGMGAGSGQALSALLTQLLQPKAQGSAVAGTPLPRPATAGGPEAAVGPRVPAALTPEAPKGPSPSALMQAISRLTQGEGEGGEPPSAEPAAAPRVPAGGGGKGLTAPVGVTQFDGKPVAAWIAPALAEAKRLGWKGTVSSGYRSKAEQERIYASGVRPAAVPGTSNHEIKAFPGGAVDVTEAQQLSKILQRTPYARLLVWAGSKDPVHFSHPVGGRY